MADVQPLPKMTICAADSSKQHDWFQLGGFHDWEDCVFVDINGLLKLLANSKSENVNLAAFRQCRACFATEILVGLPEQCIVLRPGFPAGSGT